MTSGKAQEYTYTIHYSPEEGGYVAYVAEFPALRSAAGATPQAALHALMVEVVDELQQLDDAGEAPPMAMTGS